MSENIVKRDEFADAFREHRQEHREDAAAILQNLDRFSLEIKENMTAQLGGLKDELVGVNRRLDTVNGRLYRHEGKIAALEAKTIALETQSQLLPPLRGKKAMAVAAGGGVTLMAVFYSFFETIKAIGPTVAKMLGW